MRGSELVFKIPLHLHALVNCYFLFLSLSSLEGGEVCVVQAARGRGLVEALLLRLV